MLKLKPLVILLLTLCVVQNESAKILAFWPTPSFSHQVAFRPLVKELARRGHQVVTVTTDPEFPKGEAPPNLREIDVHDVSYQHWQPFLETSTGRKGDSFAQWVNLMTLLAGSFEKQLLSPEVQDLIRYNRTDFDLVMVEENTRPALSLSHVFKAPLVLVGSFGSIWDNYGKFGIPVHPLIYPPIIVHRWQGLNVFEKAIELFKLFRVKLAYSKYEEVENAMVRKHLGEDVPSLSDLHKNAQMFFMNVHPIWDGNRPVPPSIVYMNGIHVNPIKKLPQDLNKYLDNAKNGVIYMSFGTNTNVKFLSPEKINVIMTVFKQLPYNILWKWDKDELPGQSTNIKFAKWLPQPDLLRHPNVKLFISQGGLQSSDEAITAGVPLIGIPMLCDQWYNTQKYEELNIGKALDIETLTVEQLNTTIHTILNDESYRNNIIKLRELMNDQPEKPLERFIWWTEHVLRHKGAQHLRSPAANMPWTEYLELELVLTLLAVLVAMLSLLVYVLYSFWSYILSFVKTNDKLKKS